MNGDQYDVDYFLHGRKSGKSLYDNYRWMPDLTIPMCKVIAEHCGIKDTDSILDFGCARGYVVKAFRELGYLAWGTDISRWAIENADEAAKQYLYLDDGMPDVLPHDFDWVIAKDVLEHVGMVQHAVKSLQCIAQKGIFVVVPLGHGMDGYIVPEYDKDVTHIHRMSLKTWAGMFMRPGWSVEARYRLNGIKDNYAAWADGNGILTCRRVGL